ncbi:hypothetical protein Hanom_Chr17g01554951 [Helianthus anomalus]
MLPMLNPVVKAVSKTAWLEKATSFAATGIICIQGKGMNADQ